MSLSPSGARPLVVSRVVLDASALLAVLRHERGSEKLTPALLKGAMVSTVNLCEVQSKLVTAGMPGDAAWDSALSLVREVVPFTSEQARITGDLITRTRPFGLSLGDRACLALGLLQKATIYTADASWSKLKLGVSIHSIR